MKADMARLFRAFAKYEGSAKYKYSSADQAVEFADALLGAPQAVRCLLADTPESKMTIARIETYDRILSTLEGEEESGELEHLADARREAAIELAGEVVDADERQSVLRLPGVDEAAVA